MGGACSGGSGGLKNSPNVKMLLLGGANVGKSTIFKQMRILYKQGFEEKDREYAKACIFENIVETLVELDAATDNYGVDILDENEDLADELKPVLLQFKVRDDSKPLDIEMPWEPLERLWRDPGIQSVFQEFEHPTTKTVGAADRSLPAVTGYFLQQLDRIKRASYVPSDDDMLHLRRSTTDSHSIDFKMEVVSLIGKPITLRVQCTDVGGQAHERTEWPKHAENLQAILYVLSLADYSNVSKNGNELQKQLDILSLVQQTECFQGATIIVLLNKVDLLEGKLQGLKVSDFFPDYSGPNDLESVLAFFRQKVCTALNVSPGEEESASSNIITSCATDTRLMATIIERIGESILQKTLAESKFFG